MCKIRYLYEVTAKHRISKQLDVKFTFQIHGRVTPSQALNKDESDIKDKQTCVVIFKTVEKAQPNRDFRNDVDSCILRRNWLSVMFEALLYMA